MEFKVGDYVFRKIGGEILEVIDVKEKGVLVKPVIRDSLTTSRALIFCLIRHATPQEITDYENRAKNRTCTSKSKRWIF